MGVKRHGSKKVKRCWADEYKCLDFNYKQEIFECVKAYFHDNISDFKVKKAKLDRFLVDGLIMIIDNCILNLSARLVNSLEKISNNRTRILDDKLNEFSIEDEETRDFIKGVLEFSLQKNTKRGASFTKALF